MHKLVTICQEIQDNMGYYLKLFKLGSQKGVSPEQIIKLVQMADSIHKLQDKFQGLQREILDISRRKSAGQEELKNLHDEISNTKEKLDLVKKTFNTKYGDYQEFETTVRNEVGGILSDNKKLLQNALFSVLLALRNDPDRYFIVDRIELTGVYFGLAHF